MHGPPLRALSPAMLSRRFPTRLSGPRGSLIPLPEGVTAAKDGLKASFGNLRGGLALPETTAGGGGDRGGAPARDWRVERLGADPPAGLVSLRDAVEISVLSVCGIPPALAIGVTDGVTALREAFTGNLSASYWSGRSEALIAAELVKSSRGLGQADVRPAERRGYSIAVAGMAAVGRRP